MADSLTDFLQGLPSNSVAIDDDHRHWTVGDLQSESRRLASGLRALGIGPGDRVALWLPNIPQWLALFFACARIGAIAVSVNTRFRANEVEDIVGRSGCRMLVLWPTFKGIDFAGILGAVDPAALSSLTDIVAFSTAGESVDFRFAGRRCSAYADLARHDEEAMPAADAESRCVIFTTSGTTRAPKFVCHTQKGIVQHIRDVAVGFGMTTPGSRVLQALPLCGVFGFTQALAALAGGAPMRMMAIFDEVDAAAVMQAECITHVNGSDEMLVRLLASRPEPRPFPHLRSFGFARFNPALDDLVERAQARGVIACGLYGMSECLALYALQPLTMPAAERSKGGGALISPQASVRVCDPETGRVLAAGEQGELELRGPSLLLEYYGNPQASKDAFTADGWFRSGDLGYLEADGRFGDVLRLGGFLTSPQEIEAVLEAEPSVAGAQVVGVNLDGEPVAVGFVIASDQAEFREDELREWCRSRLAGYKVPRRIFRIDEFPTTPSANGTKIQRTKLRQLAIERCA